MSRVFWDTNLFIYLFEDAGGLGARVAEIRARMLERGDQLYTSTLTLGEVLVKPIEAGDEDLRQRYEEIILGRSVVLPFSVEASRVYARVRNDRAIRPPDAIQLACASHARIDLFITNDDRLSSRSVEGVQFITSLDRAFL